MKDNLSRNKTLVEKTLGEKRRSEKANKIIVALLEIICREMTAQRISDQMLARRLGCDEQGLPHKLSDEDFTIATAVDILDFLGYDLGFQISKR